MKLNAYRDTEYFVIELDGDLDASSSIALDGAIASAAENGETKILIDCTKLDYIASAGLGVFMSYLQDFESNNISLVLFNLNQKVRKVFQILGLDELIKIVQTKDEAKSFADES